jgi:hypothetical protein
VKHFGLLMWEKTLTSQKHIGHENYHKPNTSLHRHVVKVFSAAHCVITLIRLCDYCR